MVKAPATYREYLPAPPLGEFVECLWTRGAASAPPADSHRVLPDGCMDIVFQIEVKARGWARVVGTMSRPLDVSAQPHSRFVGVRFRPGKARLFLDFRAQDLTDLQADLAHFWGRAGTELLAAMGESHSPRHAVALAERALRARIPQRNGEPRVAGAVATILNSRGAHSVETLAREAGISRQHLNNSFRDWVGVSPKFFSRVIRFRFLLELLATRRPVHWAELALEAGYFDQAHLIAEFREFSDQSPEAYLRSRLSRRAPAG